MVADPSAAASKFLIQDIWPTRELHVIGGPSGAGKTTLLLQLIEQWVQARPAFDLWASYPQPYCYVACDRSRASMTRTVQRVGIQIELPILSLIEEQKDSKLDFSRVLAMARTVVPKLRVLFIDAIAVLCPGGKISEYAVVAEMLTDISRLCQQQNITVVGLGHAAKSREGEGFANPRHRFLGSVAWGGFTDTMFFIEPTDPKVPEDPRRTIYVLPRNSPSRTLHYRFADDGRLEATQSTSTAREMLEQCAVGAIEQTGSITCKQFLELAEQLKISERTAYRVLDSLCDRKVIRLHDREYLLNK
jgi:RecA-family ATPase